ncbi:hypothetical protein C8Q76DRAFT_692273 [Earliella scabrosa]|nr:hypothetical protein C8Q76DRAFT_692273 [Earliella scabrosa]
MSASGSGKQRQDTKLSHICNCEALCHGYKKVTAETFRDHEKYRTRPSAHFSPALIQQMTGNSGGQGSRSVAPGPSRQAPLIGRASTVAGTPMSSAITAIRSLSNVGYFSRNFGIHILSSCSAEHQSSSNQPSLSTYTVWFWINYVPILIK